MYKAAAWRTRALQRNEELQDAVSSLPSPKVSTSAGLEPYIRRVLELLPQLVFHYGSMRHRKWRKKVRAASDY